MSNRSTKRQQELLDHVDRFIKEHGYGPSYREIMNALGYKSVSTVAVHIDGLIAKGYLRKRDHSARSLEVITSKYTGDAVRPASSPSPAKERWLVEAVESRFAEFEKTHNLQYVDELYVLIGTLKILGFDGAYEAMRTKLATLLKV